MATSQPLATRAGLRALERGGNAADAALAAAAVLAVTEPTGNSIGGDNFAIVWNEGRADGLDSAGAAPQRCPHTNVTTHGAESVTVPGAVGGWAALAERYGRLGLDRCLSDAIAAAENGFAVTPLTAAAWARGAHVPKEYLPAPLVGEIVRLPDLAGTLRGIAENGPSAFYEGEVARSIASVTWLDEEDLAAHGLAGSSRSRSRTAATPCSSCRRRPRVLQRSRAWGCSSDRRLASRRRSVVCSLRSRTHLRVCVTVRT